MVPGMEASACFRVRVRFEGSASAGRLIIVIGAIVRQISTPKAVRESPPREAGARCIPLGDQPQ